MSGLVQRITLPYKSPFESSLVNRSNFGVIPKGLFGDFTLTLSKTGGPENNQNSIIITPGPEPLVAVFPAQGASPLFPGTNIHIEYPEAWEQLDFVQSDRPWLVLRYAHASDRYAQSAFKMVAWENVYADLAYNPVTDIIIGRFYFDGLGDIITTHYDATYQTRYSLKYGVLLNDYLRVRTAVSNDPGLDAVTAQTHFRFEGGTINIDGDDYTLPAQNIAIDFGDGSAGHEFFVHLDLAAIKANASPKIICEPVDEATTLHESATLLRYTTLVNGASEHEHLLCRRIPCLRYVNTYTSEDVQFALLAGRSGGQTLTGGVATTQRLTLRGNAADLTSGGVTIADTTVSTTPTTGALVVSGGLGIGGAVFAGSQVTINQNSFGGPAGLLLRGGANVNYGTIGVSLINTTGSDVQGLLIAGKQANNVAGAEHMGLSIETMAAGTRAEAFTLSGAGNMWVKGTATIASSQVSSGSSSGALVVTGGAGIGGDLNVAGGIRSGTTVLTAGTNLNAVTLNGWYYGAGLTNAPTSAAYWYQVIRANGSSDVIQIAWAASGAQTHVARRCVGTAWGWWGVDYAGTGSRSIAFGAGSLATHDSSAAIGPGAATTTTDQIALGCSSASVYIASGTIDLARDRRFVQYLNIDPQDINGEDTSLSSYCWYRVATLSGTNKPMHVRIQITDTGNGRDATHQSVVIDIGKGTGYYSAEVYEAGGYTYAHALMEVRILNKGVNQPIAIDVRPGYSEAEQGVEIGNKSQFNVFVTFEGEENGDSFTFGGFEYTADVTGTARYFTIGEVVRSFGSEQGTAMKIRRDKSMSLLGALDVGGALNVTGNTRIISTTASTSTTTGALVVAGGIGVAENSVFGGSLIFNSTRSFWHDVPVLGNSGYSNRIMLYSGKFSPAANTNQLVEVADCHLSTAGLIVGVRIIYPYTHTGVDSNTAYRELNGEHISWFLIGGVLRLMAWWSSVGAAQPIGQCRVLIYYTPNDIWN